MQLFQGVPQDPDFASNQGQITIKVIDDADSGMETEDEYMSQTLKKFKSAEDGIGASATATTPSKQ